MRIIKNYCFSVLCLFSDMSSWRGLLLFGIKGVGRLNSRNMMWLPSVQRSYLHHPLSIQPHVCASRRYSAQDHDCQDPSTSSDYQDSSTLSWSPILKGLLALVGVGISFSISSYTFPEADLKWRDFLSFQAYCREEEAPKPKPFSKRYNFIAEAVEKAAPSLVFIQVSRKVPTLFGLVQAMEAGSGFVIEDGSYVLTNAHVVSNAQSVEVKLNSGKVVRGEVTDVDEVTDLAIIKIHLPSGTVPPPPLTFGDSNELRPGEWVVAMGSPLSLTNTITCGIVSSIQRPSEELGIRNDMEYIQTDAAITVGNSGGPLVNLDGEVIGINTMTAAPGISFAIPSSTAQNFVRSANKKATGRFAPQANKKYSIGVSMLRLERHIMPMLQNYFSIPKEVTSGVLLVKVWAHSPASLAGLQVGDIVVRINGEDIKSTKDMFRMVRSGKKLSVEYYRELRYMTCTVVPEAMN